MNLLAILETTFTSLDSAAFLALIVAWLATGFSAEYPPGWRPSVTILMKEYRRLWMVEFLTREPRIFDISLIESLRQGTAFFGSGRMIAIRGGVALIGATLVTTAILIRREFASQSRAVMMEKLD